MTTWHVIPVKAENVMHIIEKIDSPELSCDKCHRDFFGADCY